jgi:hypothetical protein
MIKNICWSYCTVPDFLVRFLMELVFFYIFPKKKSNINFTEIRPNGNRIVQCGRTEKTDTTKLRVAFRNVAKALKIFVSHLLFCQLNLLIKKLRLYSYPIVMPQSCRSGSRTVAFYLRNVTVHKNRN